MQIERIQWDYDAWEEYCEWQRMDKSVVKRINLLIKDIRRHPFEGIGKPEPLRENLSAGSMKSIGSSMRWKMTLW